MSTPLWIAISLTLPLGLTLGLLRAGQRHNGADWGGPWLNRLDGLNRLFCRHFHRLRDTAVGLPATGPALLVSNHVSGLDPLLMIAACPRPLRFLIAREQYERRSLKWLFRAIGCIPVDRNSRPERALRAALRALEQGEVVALFPHGGIHLDHEPRRPLKAGVAWLAQRARCPIVPLRIDGIRRQGSILLAPWVRSRVVLTPRPAIHCALQETRECLHRVQAALERQPPAADGADSGLPSPPDGNPDDRRHP